MNQAASLPFQPLVRGFFDPGTWTVTYVVCEAYGQACAIIDSVLDYDPKSGRTSTASADGVASPPWAHASRWCKSTSAWARCHLHKAMGWRTSKFP